VGCTADGMPESTAFARIPKRRDGANHAAPLLPCGGAHVRTSRRPVLHFGRVQGSVATQDISFASSPCATRLERDSLSYTNGILDPICRGEHRRLVVGPFLKGRCVADPNLRTDFGIRRQHIWRITSSPASGHNPLKANRAAAREKACRPIIILQRVMTQSGGMFSLSESRG
jgi:hypothetical protein